MREHRQRGRTGRVDAAGRRAMCRAGGVASVAQIASETAVSGSERLGLYRPCEMLLVVWECRFLASRAISSS